MVINQQKLISFNYHHDLATLNNVNDKILPVGADISNSFPHLSVPILPIL